jgi:hypothetical protein
VIGWLVLAAYVLGWLVTMRIMHASAKRDNDVDVFCEIFGSLFWPLLAALFVVCGFFYGAFLLATHDFKMPRLRFRRSADQQRIRELEAQLGMSSEETP